MLNFKHWSMPMSGLRTIVFALIAAIAMVTNVVSAQSCGAGWVSGFGGAGPNGPVRAILPLPNGQMVIGGTFTYVDGRPMNNVARWDGSSWSRLGEGMNTTVFALALLPSGEIVAGGAFRTAEGRDVFNIARWDGSSWSSLGGGTTGTGTVRRLAVLPNGDLIMGGSFSWAGGADVGGGIARWDGHQWASMGYNVFNVTALVVAPNGDVVAAGDFTEPSGVPANRIARWNGTTWAPLGSGVNASVFSLDFLPNGDMVAGGSFTIAGGVSCPHIARWTGVEWLPLSTGSSGTISDIQPLADGRLIALGGFSTVAGVSLLGLAQWDGVEWSQFGGGFNNFAEAIAIAADGDIIVGGGFTTAGGIPVPQIARYDFGVAPLAVVEQPESQTVCEGAPVQIAAVFSGGSPTYQWYRNDEALQGEVSNILRIASLSPADSGTYRCTATNACGSISTTAVAIDVIPRLAIELQPVDQAVAAGASASFFIAIAANEPCTTPLTFQWQRRNPAVLDPDSPGAWIDLLPGGDFINPQSSGLIITRPIPALATGYRCRIGGGCGCRPQSGFIYTEVVNFSIACPADFNADGGVDGSDIEAFFERWENGC